MSGIANLQDVERAEATLQSTDLPQSTYQMIQRGAAINPEAPALSFFLTADAHQRAETWSYAELLARITQTANFFHQLGVDKDTVIAFVLPNLPETHFVVWGGQAAGIVTAINPLLEPAAIAELLSAAQAAVLVTLAPFPGADIWPKMAAVIPQVPCLRQVVLVNMAAHLPGQSVTKMDSATLRQAPGIQGTVPAELGLHDLHHGIADQPVDVLLSGRRIAAQDFSSFFCTGGTTGLPKIAMRRHANEVANAWSTGQFFGDGIGPGKVLFCGLPMFHVNAVLVTGLLPFSRGAHVILGTPGGYRGEGLLSRFWEIVEHHRINFFSGVPTIYASLLQVPIGERDVSSLEFGLCGAAPLPVEVMRNFQDRTGLKILEGYGLTEGTCASSVNPPQGERRLGSIGIRIPGQQMKAVILDEQGAYQRDCAVDEVGVLLIAGANVFAGYKIESQNLGLWVDCGDDQRWLNTGDLARQDAEGYFWLTGRKKELIIRGGHNIDPQTIEEPLHSHPAVQVAAAVGRPDAHAGELPVAYVQLRAGAVVSEQELLDHCRENIRERAAQPKFIRVIEQIPLTGVGKIYKPALKLRETQDALHAACAAAGIAVQRLEVVDDKTRGLSVSLAITNDADSDAAATVLGQFPFLFRIDVGERAAGDGP